MSGKIFGRTYIVFVPVLSSLCTGRKVYCAKVAKSTKKNQLLLVATPIKYYPVGSCPNNCTDRHIQGEYARRTVTGSDEQEYLNI